MDLRLSSVVLPNAEQLQYREDNPGDEILFNLDHCTYTSASYARQAGLSSLSMSEGDGGSRSEGNGRPEVVLQEERSVPGKRNLRASHSGPQMSRGKRLELSIRPKNAKYQLRLMFHVVQERLQRSRTTSWTIVSYQSSLGR